ncbi:MAG: hypothetical protein LBM04_05525, partial [Opitutaceae bacterium]|nr:hypothetical protein [Opitutaceae bacterium]
DTVAWALCLPASAGATLGALRLLPAIEIAETTAHNAHDTLHAHDTLWLRGRSRDAGLENLLAAIPATARHDWLDGDRLRPQGSLLASEKLPALTWQPLRAWMRVTLPVAALPASRPAALALSLANSHDAQTANAAFMTLPAWRDWAMAAPALRLDRLRFAVSDEGLCIILGAPPPPVRCRLFWESEGIIVPCGMAWHPRVTGKTVRKIFGVSDGTIVFWDESGARFLNSEMFIPASRASVRATHSAFFREPETA